ncbi:hypothetical protein [Flavobacterium psychrophilum]|uniref:hypothetical protein n=1 Tax=Flavobacterium psychrophilum TaxID=96345 RepID=UPI000B7C45AD|nr:hypothetical protein [Flavobacterium psychrophilum]EKT3967123.1 hypothetical protein [Flavobacterium psychrophilum]MBF2024839.1 hypothetical protein [Flavobacterium psychrophilum]MCB5983172.1 hypothetical protein [Flavobacterium psychrophilum]MCB5995489.1 hypothetical protein [Flavobacterium psychrophilum]MCB5997756.1 hypothetical protein [Flavobacterium psychrophilum]
MAFYLTSDITIGTHKKVKPAKVSWKTDINSFTDTCTIELPRITYLKTVKSTTEDKQQANERKEYDIKENDKITIFLGYDGKNEKHFEGFVKRVNMSIPVKVECEGYSYLLYNIMFNKTYSNVTVKQLLTDLCTGTEIVLSSEIPLIPLKNVRFKNATGIQVLEWLKKECKLAVYFNFNELFVGTLFGKTQATVKFKLGWNTVKDDDFKQRIVDKNVRIVINEKNDKGEVKKIKSDVHKYSDEKTVKVKAGIPADLLKQIANRLQTKSNYHGYEGNITAFLEPAVNKGMKCEIDGFKYPEKSGNFLVESITGEFGTGGGRQTIGLAFLMTT